MLYFINPLMTNGLARHYQLGESTVVLGNIWGIRSDFEFSFYFLARLHEVHRAIVVTSVVHIYVYVYVCVRVRVTFSVKVF